MNYPYDFIGKLKLIKFIDRPSGMVEEHYEIPSGIAMCLWFPGNQTLMPSTILYYHDNNPFKS